MERDPEKFKRIEAVSYKKAVHKISQYSMESTCVGVSFCQSCRPSGLQLYYKK